MTIRFITAWNGYRADQVVSGLGGAEETRLIGLGFAVADLDGPDNTPLPVVATTNLTGRSRKSIGGVLDVAPTWVPVSGSQIVAFVGDSLTQAAGATSDVTRHTGWQSGHMSNVLSGSYTTLNASGTFVVVARGDAACATSDSVVIAFDGVKYMTVAIAGDGAGTAVDVTGGGIFHLSSGTNGKGINVALRWAAKPAGAASDTLTNPASYIQMDAIGGWNTWIFPALAKNGYYDLDVRNYGITGDSSTDILARIGQVAEISPDVVFVLIGANDVATSFATTVANMTAIITALPSSLVVLCLTFPRGDYSASQASLWGKTIQSLRLLRDSFRVLVFDGASLLTTPTGTSGAGLIDANAFRTDNIHVNMLGTIQSLAPKLLTDVIQKVFPIMRPAICSAANAYDATYNPAGNAIGAVGTFAGSAGTVNSGAPTLSATGTIGTGWTDTDQGSTAAGATIVYSQATARSDNLPGVFQRAVVVAGGSGPVVRRLAAALTPAAGVLRGKKIRLHAAIRLSSATKVNALYAVVYLSCASRNAFVYACDIFNTAAMLTTGGTLSDSGVMYLSSQVLTVPDDYTSGQVRLQHGCATSGGYTIDFQDVFVEIVG